MPDVPKVEIALWRADAVVSFALLAVLLAPVLTACSPTSIGTDETRAVPAGAVQASAPDGDPRFAASWAGRDRITVTTWGSSSCPTGPVRIERTGPQEVEVEVRATGDEDDCTADLSPTTSTVVLPEGVDDGAPLAVLVDDGGETGTRLTLPARGTG